MTWVFQRNHERIRCEVSRDGLTGTYRLAVTRPDGTETVDEMQQPTELIDRCIEVMGALRADGWKAEN